MTGEPSPCHIMEGYMHILVVNDDGIFAEGIYELAKELSKKHRVTVVAPSEQKSAQSHAITIYKPLVIKKVELEGLDVEAYSVSGTPADCVRAAIDRIIAEEDKVDLIVSGINLGVNLGMDILYSGTVSAAIEGSLYNKPAIAVSADVDVYNKGRFDLGAKYVSELIYTKFENFKDLKEVLNINVPNLEDKDVKGIMPCKIGGVIYDYYTQNVNELGEKIVKVNRDKPKEQIIGTDRYYINEGYITITPLEYNLTSYEALENIRGWI